MWHYPEFSDQPLTASEALDEWLDTVEIPFDEFYEETLFSNTDWRESAEYNLRAIEAAADYHGYDLDGLGYPLPVLYNV